MSGKVYLVGAGPGDPQLMTLRAASLLETADVILYDRLVHPDIIGMIPSSTPKEYVGRAVGDDHTHQDSTNHMMLRHALKGRQVVRLKGGDPIIFGRGGEEAQYLKSNSVPYEIVPGVTSGVGSATYSGIPLTHRSHSSSVLFVTGHEDPAKESPVVHWNHIAKSVDTIVIMMGLSRLEQICGDLIDGGMSADTPVAVIQNGTTPEHRMVTGTIRDIVTVVRDCNIRPPANIIIGKVVDLHQEISWR